MKNEELITMLSYLAYKKRKNGVKPEEYLNIYVRNERKNARFTNKNQITNVLGEISRNDDKIFGDAINDVKIFFEKLSILAGENFKDWNDLLSHTKKNTQSKTNQNYYLLWIALNNVEKDRLLSNKVGVFNKVSSLFKECQEIKEEEFDVSQFISRLGAI